MKRGRKAILALKNATGLTTNEASIGMPRNKDINNFIRDVKDGSKFIGNHIPIVKQGMEAHEVYRVCKRLGISTPRAIQVAKKAFKNEIRKKRKRLQSKVRNRLRFR